MVWGFGKGEHGTSDMDCLDGGYIERNIKMKGRRNYNLTLGFLYDASNVRLYIVDVSDNTILLMTEKLKGRMGSKCEYVPAFGINPGYDCDVKVTYKTGSDISEIPPCLLQVLY